MGQRKHRGHAGEAAKDRLSHARSGATAMTKSVAAFAAGEYPLGRPIR
jgi:hypothetical protein